MSVFRSRKNKPSQLELLRRLEEESEIGKVRNPTHQRASMSMSI